jgi:hypothetical protein
MLPACMLISCLAYSSTPKMEVMCSSKMLVDFLQTMQQSTSLEVCQPTFLYQFLTFHMLSACPSHFINFHLMLWGLKFIFIILINPLQPSCRIHSPCIINFGQLMLFGEIIAVCSETHTKCLNKCAWPECLNSRGGGTYSYHCALKAYKL